MARPVFVRRNAAILPWLRAVAFAATTFLALAAVGFYPGVLPGAIAFVVGVLGLLAPGIGVLVFVLATGVPLAAGDILAGALFMLLGFATIQYLADDHGRNFLIIALAFAGTLVGAEWAVAVVAGLLLGSGEGAVVAFLACLAIEVAGLLLGRPAIGVLATGGSPSAAIVDLARVAALRDPLTFGWVADSLGRLDAGLFTRAVTTLRDPVQFVVQPFLWAAAAALASLLRRQPTDPRRGIGALVAAAAGIAALAVGSITLNLIVDGPVSLGVLALAAAVSAVVALGTAVASEWVFTLQPAAEQATASSMDEADVDELLRMISTAEEELASKHTVRRTVLITDMKSFSRITEELGSTETARLVQRHRDLLLPLVERFGGHGKSTGGDGLLAAFESPGAALQVSVEMQRVLAEYNAKRPGEEEILIRAGVATGEVVLDKGGKPFLGDALNRAARVMSLADGGQIFTTEQDVDTAGEIALATVSHGEFRLKNIAQPVEIVEVLWREDQEARPPHGVPQSG